MNIAGEVYRQALWREPAVLRYLQERHIPAWVARRCKLGYADGHTLGEVLRHQRRRRLAQQLGLLWLHPKEWRRSAVPPPGWPRDVLAGRLIVQEPRAGHRAGGDGAAPPPPNYIWFIGRQLVDAAPDPKYRALPGRRPILGLERATRAGESFLCEGVFDYLTAVAWQLPAWSALDTHVRPAQLAFLATTPRVWGVFDVSIDFRRGFGILSAVR